MAFESRQARETSTNESVLYAAIDEAPFVSNRRFPLGWFGHSAATSDGDTVMKSHGPDVAELRWMLADRLDEIVPRILVQVRRESSDLVGYATSDGAKILVGRIGRKRGVVLDTAEVGGRREGRRGGNLMNLVIAELGQGDLAAGCRAAEQLLGIARVPGPPPSRALGVDDRAQAARDKEASAAIRANAAKRAQALRLYRNAVRPIEPGTPVDSYLRGRKLLPVATLRFSPSAPRFGWGADVARDTRIEAMFAPVVDPTTGKQIALHITYLQRIDGLWRKSNAAPAKIVLGPCAGGVIPLTLGASGRRLLAAAEGDGVLIAEGIENALTASLLRPELRAMAAISVGNLANIVFPATVRLVALVRDRDGNGRGAAQARQARDRFITRMLNEGRLVEVIDPPVGLKDLNDAWQACHAPRIQGNRN